MLPLAVGRKLLPAIIRSQLKKIRSLPNLTRYLIRVSPDILLSSTTVSNLISLWAAHRAKVQTAFFVKQDNTLSEASSNASGPLNRIVPGLVEDWYPRADGIFAVSAGVSDELHRIASVPQDRIHILYNPIDLKRIATLSEENLDDPWFQAGQPPVIVSTGRLHPQKDFPTLLQAMKLLGSDPKIRLVILGEGQERTALEELIRRFALRDHVRLIGFKANPYAYMSRASVFVLSSAWEGLSNVLIEALACGCRIVSTDCPYGPSEILENGEYGVLVPVRNPEALAKAIRKILNEPAPKEKNKKQSQMYDIHAIAAQYLGHFSKVRKKRSPT
jgi:glycosyltransferase involved in cell wall biosynthesis